MSKVSKKKLNRELDLVHHALGGQDTFMCQLAERIETLEETVTALKDMLQQKEALAESTLSQTLFEGLSERYKYVVLNKQGFFIAYESEPEYHEKTNGWVSAEQGLVLPNDAKSRGENKPIAGATVRNFIAERCEF